MDEIVTKICTKCGIGQDLSCYYKDKRTKSGYRSWCKECNKKYCRNNKEAKAAYDKEYNKKNKEVTAKRSKLYRENNKETLAEGKKGWSKNNRDKRNEAEQRRNALKKSLTVENVDYRVIRERDDTCYLCSVKFTEEERWSTSLTHVDHKIPLTRTELNPTHSYKNCALTHKKCNLTKNDKTPEEFWNKLALNY